METIFNSDDSGSCETCKFWKPDSNLKRKAFWDKELEETDVSVKPKLFAGNVSIEGICQNKQSPKYGTKMPMSYRDDGCDAWSAWVK